MEFRVLGPFQVIEGERVLDLGGPKQRAVLALLVLEPNRVVSMDRLVSRLWGDEPPARAVGTVHGYVSNLRRVLEPGRRPGEPARLLVTQAPGYALQVARDDVDWLRLERLAHGARSARDAGDLAAAEAMLAEALLLWRGPPLADLALTEVPELARLSDLRLGALEERAEVLLRLGRHDEVVADIDAVAAEYPLRERLRGLQMVALYRAGRQVEALAVYGELRRRLAEEHGLDPGAALQRLHAQILRHDPGLEPVRPVTPPAGPRASGAPTPFVGRLAELAALREHLHAARAGSGRVVLVEGEPGIGKTALAQAAGAEAAALGFLVVWGRCAEGESAPALWPWAQVLRSAGADRDLAALAAEHAHLDPHLARGQLGRALADLLREQAQEQPLLLVLDDLQWADEASLELLELAAADLTDTRVLVLGTYREVDVPRARTLASTLGVLARLPGAGRLTLSGLDADEVASLVRAHVGAEPAAGLAAAVYRRTEGNPFFVTELLRLGSPEQLVHGPVPAGVRDVVRRRVAGLPHDTRQLLDVAALMDRDAVDLRLAARLCGLAPDAGLELAEPAIVRGLLAAAHETGGGYRFTHALVRETLAEDLAPSRKAQLHARIAAALLEAYGEDREHAAEVAEHLWESLPVGEVEPTLRAQARAAEAAWAGLAYERAEALLERASGLLRSLPPADAPPSVDLGVHVRLGSLRSARHGYTPAAREAFDRARLLAERLDRHGDLVSALCGLSATAVVRGDLNAAGELTDAALAEARHDRDGAALAVGNLGVGIVAFYRGQLATARGLFAAAVEAWRAADPPRPAVLRGPPASARPDVMAPSYDALAACLMGDSEEATRQIARALRAAEGTGEPYAVAFVHSFHARLGVLARDRDTARAAAVEATGVADKHGFPLLAEHAAIPLGWAEASQGEPQAGLAMIERALDVLHRSGQRILTPFHRGLQAEVLLALGNPAAALARLDEALAETLDRGGGFEVPGLHLLRAQALGALGRDEQAREASQAARAVAREQGARVPDTT